MHEVIYSIRYIAPQELPRRTDIGKKTDRPATAQELLNLGMVPLGDDYYSCVEQRRSDDVLDVVRDERGSLHRQWHDAGDPHPGQVVTRGSLHERHAQLPPSAKARILRAHVVRGDVKRVNAKTVVETRMASRRRTLPRAGKLLDERALAIEAAHAVVTDKTKRVSLQRVAMGDVDPERDFVLEANLIPHHWHGER